MKEKESGNWAITWKQKIVGDVDPKWVAFARLKARGLVSYIDGTKRPDKFFSRDYMMDDGTLIMISGAQQFGRWVVDIYCSGDKRGTFFFSVSPELPEKRTLYVYDTQRFFSYQTGFFQQLSPLPFSAQYYGYVSRVSDGALVWTQAWEHEIYGAYIGGYNVQGCRSVNYPWGPPLTAFATPGATPYFPSGFAGPYRTALDGALLTLYSVHEYAPPSGSFIQPPGGGAPFGGEYVKYTVAALEDHTIVGTQDVVGAGVTVENTPTTWPNHYSIDGWAGGEVLHLWPSGSSTSFYNIFNDYTFFYSVPLDVPLDTKAPTAACGFQFIYANPAWSSSGNEYPSGDKILRSTSVRYGWAIWNFQAWKRVVGGTTEYYRWKTTDLPAGQGGEIYLSGSGENIVGQTAYELATEDGINPSYSGALYKGGDPFSTLRATWYEERSTAPVERDRLWRISLSDETLASVEAHVLPTSVAEAALAAFPTTRGHIYGGGLSVSTTTEESGEAPPADVSYLSDKAQYIHTTTTTTTFSYTDRQTKESVSVEHVGVRRREYIRHRLLYANGVSAPDILPGFWTVETTYIDFPYGSEDGSYFFCANGTTYDTYGYNSVALDTPASQAVNRKIPCSTVIDGQGLIFDVPIKYEFRYAAPEATPSVYPNETFFGVPPLVRARMPAFAEYQRQWPPVFKAPGEGEDEEEGVDGEGNIRFVFPPLEDTTYRFFFVRAEHEELGDLGVYPQFQTDWSKCQLYIAAIVDFQFSLATRLFSFVAQYTPLNGGRIVVTVEGAAGIVAVASSKLTKHGILEAYEEQQELLGLPDPTNPDETGAPTITHLPYSDAAYAYFLNHLEDYVGPLIPTQSP